MYLDNYIKIKTILFILLLVIFYSCKRTGTNKSAENKSCINAIDLIPKADSVINNLSDIANDIRYIPLKMPVNMHVSAIDKLMTCSDTIYLSTVKNLLLFSNNGQYLDNLLGRNLKIKPAINFIYDFDISSDNKKVAILSNNRIYILNKIASRFNFTRLIILQSPYPSKISFVPGTYNILLSIVPVHGSEKSLNILINELGDTLFLKPNFFKFKVLNKTPGGSADEILQYNLSDKICFKESFSDTIFYVNNQSNTFKPWYILDSKGKAYPPRARGDSYFEIFDLTEYFKIDKILEVNRYILYNYSYINKKKGVYYQASMLYDRSSKKRIMIKQNNGLKDDICGGPDFRPFTVSENKLYAWIFPYSLKTFFTSSKFIQSNVKNEVKKEELKQLAQMLKKSDNPVLIIVTPKE
jgi:hypothetical protein